MDILYHSYMHGNKQLVKVLKDGQYGIYSINDDKVIVEPAFDYLEYQSNDRLLARKDGYYFFIDNTGEKVCDVSIAEEDWDGIEKADTCPVCSGVGAACCFGFGFIPAKGDWEGFLADLD